MLLVICRVSQGSVSRVINSVVNVLSQKAMTDIKMPRNFQDIARIYRGFHRLDGFPRVIGAIDGTYIAIKPPDEKNGICPA